MEIRIQRGEGSTGVSSVLDLESLAEIVHDEGWLWIDVCDADPEVAGQLGRALGLVEDGVEDVQDLELLPKVEDHGDQLFMILHSLVVSADNERIDTLEVDCFLGRDILVTMHAEAVPGIDWLWELVSTPPVTKELDHPAGILARFAEVTGRRYLRLLLAVEDRVEDLAEAALDGDREVLESVQLLRRETATLRRIIRPQAYALRTLHSARSELLGPIDRRRLGTAVEIHDQLMEGLVETRDALGSVLDTYRGGVAERQAEVAQVLTVAAALFLPPSLLAGIFGMNFVDMPPLTWRYGWILGFALMLAVPGLLLLYFYRIGWVGDRTRTRGPQANQLGALLRRLARAPVADQRVNGVTPSDSD